MVWLVKYKMYFVVEMWIIDFFYMDYSFIQLKNKI